MKKRIWVISTFTFVGIIMTLLVPEFHKAREVAMLSCVKSINAALHSLTFEDLQLERRVTHEWMIISDQEYGFVFVSSLWLKCFERRVLVKSAQTGVSSTGKVAYSLIIFVTSVGHAGGRVGGGTQAQQAGWPAGYILKRGPPPRPPRPL